MDSAPLFISGNTFGLKLVAHDSERNLHILLNDGTRHGIQSVDPARSHEPLAYYHRSGPIGDIFSALGRTSTEGHVAIVGLGVGVMAAYAKPGMRLTFYEIDPGVVSIAEDPQYFTFLAQCRGTYKIVVGDGLANLGQAPDHHYDMVILDAFSSDRIPIHLLSREALDVYLRKLVGTGVIACHISNIHSELEPILGKLAAEANLVCLARADFSVSEEDRLLGKLPSHYVAMARSREDITALADSSDWRLVGSERVGRAKS